VTRLEACSRAIKEKKRYEQRRRKEKSLKPKGVVLFFLSPWRGGGGERERDAWLSYGEKRGL
jgi:hypothetical protein